MVGVSVFSHNNTLAVVKRLLNSRICYTLCNGRYGLWNTGIYNDTLSLPQFIY